jgi:hypothetical protein
LKNYTTDQEEIAERRRKIVNTTLGDLVVAVTDEVRPYIRDPSSMYSVVSHILADLLVRRLVSVPGRARVDTECMSDGRAREETSQRFH